MGPDEFARKLTVLFPEKETALSAHHTEYGDLLSHVFFSEQIKGPLVRLLWANTDVPTIKRYCAFIEEMWKLGDAETVNIVDVTILEELSDDSTAWRNLREYITPEFVDYINSDLLSNNMLMRSVPPL